MKLVYEKLASNLCCNFIIYKIEKRGKDEIFIRANIFVARRRQHQCPGACNYTSPGQDYIRQSTTVKSVGVNHSKTELSKPLTTLE